MITIITDTAKDKAIEIAIKALIGHSVASAYSVGSDFLSIVKPMVVADDTILMRDALIKQLEKQLDDYEDKRELADGVVPWKQKSLIQLMIENNDFGLAEPGPSIHMD